MSCRSSAFLGVSERVRARRRRRRLPWVERLPKAPESAVEGDLDGIRLQSEKLADLTCRQVGAVPKGDQLTLPLPEMRDCGSDPQTTCRIFLEIARRSPFR